MNISTIIIFSLSGLVILWIILSARKQAKKLKEEGWKKKKTYY
jgi:hypothetical protein